MSILIKGMEMPKHGEGVCLIVVTNFESCESPVAMLVDRESILPKDFYDAIEIPTPHGRMIDADKLQTAIHGCLCENCQTFPCEKGIGCLIEDVFNLLDEAPTIIEAEVSGE